MKERVLHYDLIRMVACVMVVVMHSPMPSERIIGPFTWLLTYLSMPCIGLFFVISGALLLPVKTLPSESFAFVKSRCSKFILPILFWSIVYMFVNGTFTSGDYNRIFRSVVSLPFYRQEGVLWFMYVLVGLYIVAPVISPWLDKADKNTIKKYLYLWGGSLMIPYLQPWIRFELSAYGILYYCSGFLGYFVLGYYLRRFGVAISFGKALLGLFLMLVFPLVYELFIEQYNLEFGEIFWYLSIDSPILVILWWSLLKSISEKLKHSKKLSLFCVTFSNLSFGIYLCHILIQRYGLWKMDIIRDIPNYYLQTLVVIVLTLLLSFILSFVISRTPLGNQLICYKNRL